LGNNSKTVNKNEGRNLIWGKNDQHSKIYLPCNFEVNRMIQAKFGLNWSSGFRGKDF
jgi:hypothetical protein